MEELPKSVEINEILYFKVYAEINSGTPLEKTEIKCNITTHFKATDVNS